MADMLKSFHHDVYALLDLDATLSFLTPYVTMRFDLCPSILLEPFLVSTRVNDSIVATSL